MKQTVICGDCLAGMGGMLPGSVDVVCTSPPYNLSTPYSLYEDSKPRLAYLYWLGDVFDQVQRVLKPAGSFFLNVGSTNQDPWLAMDVAGVARAFFTLQNSIAWVKSISIGETTHGHFKPINSPRYVNNCWENLFHFTKGGTTRIDRLAVGVPFMDPGNLKRGTRGKNGNRRCRGNTWFIPYETVCSKVEKGNHPAVFPVELARQCILLHGVLAGMMVLDPFLGSGTTLLACQELGISGIGYEMDPAYAACAKARLGQE